MSELCIPSSCTTSTRPQFFSLLMSNLCCLCSFMLSHPLYFSYFVFFSPYLLNFFSFLSPLFITTTLLLLTILTISPSLILHHNSASTEFSESRNVSVLLSAYNTVVERLTQNNDKIDELEEFEAYKIVFGPSIIDVQENSGEFLDCTSAEESETPVHDSSFHHKGQSLTDNFGEKSAAVESIKQSTEEPTLENLFKELDEFENKTWSHNVIEKQKEVEQMRNGPKATAGNVVYVHSQGLGQNLENVGSSYGSMSKEKEWKRTLACKLFEERHNSSYSSSEGMDLLWETHEMDTKKNKVKRDTSSFKNMKKKGESKGYHKEYDEDDEEMDQQQLCCLQALKFSSGKRNLGMGRPNLVKISKAFRGFGWLHHVSKNNKKVHCGDGF